MWVLIDNYDSFTHILHHYLLLAGGECVVYRNDALTLEALIQLNPSRLILSPGPETPLQAGITMQALAHFAPRIPVLGVCLGHQAIGMHFDAKLIHAAAPVHGKVHKMQHNRESIFKGLPSPMPVMRYHSLAVSLEGSTTLEGLAWTADGTLMALRHRQYPVVGVQFHPESVGTPDGLAMLRNWAGMYACK
jgi:anthranilate synthase/aminodeoxychorismate synthase-like glutamine amidotransferase